MGALTDRAIEPLPLPPAARRREYLFPCALALFWIAAGTFPYLYGYWSAPAGQEFMGFVGRGTPGANSYFMFSRQVLQGNFFMENRVTPEATPGGYWHPEWWLFGLFARVTGLSLIAVFHLGRIIAVPAFLLAVYYLASRCLRTPFERRFALALVALGSGFGWLLFAANHYLGTELIPSRDLRGVSFPAYLVNKPHFIRAGIFAALKYAFLLEAMRSGRQRYAVYCGLAAMAHSSIRPFHVPDFYCMCLFFPLFYNLWAGRWSWKRVQLGAVAGIVHLPAMAYFFWMSWTNPLGLAKWARVPGFLFEYVLWAGWPFAVCCAALLIAPWFFRFRQFSDGTVMLGLWMLICWGFCNLYPYYNAGQEASLYGFFIPGSILAASIAVYLLRVAPAGLARWPERAALARHRLFAPSMAVLLVAAAMPSTLLVYSQFFSGPGQSQNYWAHYLSSGFVDACEWLDENSAANDVVIASHDASQFIPRLTNNKTVTGQDVLTVNYAEKNALINRFFGTPGDDDFKEGLLRQYQVRYVVWSDLERQIGAMQPADYPWFRRVYESADAAVYAVDLDAPA